MWRAVILSTIILQEFLQNCGDDNYKEHYALIGSKTITR